MRLAFGNGSKTASGFKLTGWERLLKLTNLCRTLVNKPLVDFKSARLLLSRIFTGIPLECHVSKLSSWNRLGLAVYSRWLSWQGEKLKQLYRLKLASWDSEFCSDSGQRSSGKWRLFSFRNPVVADLHTARKLGVSEYLCGDCRMIVCFVWLFPIAKCWLVCALLLVVACWCSQDLVGFVCLCTNLCNHVHGEDVVSLFFLPSLFCYLTC